MKIEDIKEMMKIDAHIEYASLDTESLRTPELCSKYNQLLFEERQHLEFLENMYNVKRFHRFQYYAGKADPEVYEKKPFDHKVLKSDMESYLKSDIELIEKEVEVKTQKHKIKMIEDFLKDSLCSRQWLIGHAIKWKMLGDGLL